MAKALSNLWISFVLHLEPNTSSPLNTQAASLWINQEGKLENDSLVGIRCEYPVNKAHKCSIARMNYILKVCFILVVQNIGRWWRSCTSLQRRRFGDVMKKRGWWSVCDLFVWWCLIEWTICYSKKYMLQIHYLFELRPFCFFHIRKKNIREIFVLWSKTWQ